MSTSASSSPTRPYSGSFDDPWTTRPYSKSVDSAQGRSASRLSDTDRSLTNLGLDVIVRNLKTVEQTITTCASVDNQSTRRNIREIRSNYRWNHYELGKEIRRLEEDGCCSKGMLESLHKLRGVFDLKQSKELVKKELAKQELAYIGLGKSLKRIAERNSYAKVLLQEAKSQFVIGRGFSSGSPVRFEGDFHG